MHKLSLKNLALFLISSSMLAACMATTTKDKDRLRIERIGFSAYDLNGDTYVTEDEIKSCYLQSFNKMDKNSDGVVDAEEDQDAMSSYFIRFRKSSPKKCEDAFQVKQVGQGSFAGLVENFDKNQDGVLTQPEFLGIHLKARQDFLSHDLNSDSKITETEALESIKSKLPKLKF